MDHTAQPALLRRLGLVSAMSLVISNMVGTGIFASNGFLIDDLGTPRLVLLSWLAGGVCALLGALCYAELAVNFPASGGEYLFLSRAYGSTWAFISGWTSFFAGFSAPVAAAALAFASYATAVLAGTRQASLIHSHHLLACALVIVLAIWNSFGIRLSALLQNGLTAIKVLSLIAFLVCGFSLGNGNWTNLTLPTTRSSTIPVWQQFATSLFWIYVGYSGWNAAVYVSEEIRRPERTLTRALALGTAFVIGLYLALTLLFFYSTPADSMKGVLAVGALAASRLFGPSVATLFSALMAFSLISTVNAMTITGPRVYYAMARDGSFLRAAARVHPRWHTPVVSIAAQTLCTVVLIFTPFPQLIVYIGFTLNFFAVLSVAALFRLRRRPGWTKLAGVSFAYPLLPAVFVAIGSWMTIEGIRQKPTISLLSIATLVTGAVAHRIHWKHAPTSPQGDRSQSPDAKL
jgi:APA family basic amino acid/polyamine antiporter